MILAMTVFELVAVKGLFDGSIVVDTCLLVLMYELGLESVYCYSVCSHNLPFVNLPIKFWVSPMSVECF